MINRHELSKEQVMYAIEMGEFSEDIIASTNTVVVIMTQDWCPQWHDISGWIYKMDIHKDIDIYELVYNKKDYAKEFMNLKENKWGNDLIPYLRYYRNGELYKETNYVSMKKFGDLIET